MTIQQYLQKNKIITDGSFGTYYADRYKTFEMPEMANMLYPERVKEIHESYIEAGSKLIRTNTFAANTVMTGDRFEAVQENIRAAVRIAKEAVSECEQKGICRGSEPHVYIAGDIGPIPKDDRLSDEDIEEQYYKIAKTFIDEGITILT